MDNFSVLRVENHKKDLVCPFRTKTISYQDDTNSVIQIIEFPECHYNKCPFLYNK